jgi:hypothetical protein
MQTAALNTRSVVPRKRSTLEAFIEDLALAYFEPQERRNKQLNVRVSPSVEKDIKTLARLWTIASQAKSGDEEVEVSENDTAFRLLKASAPAAIAEMLGPSTKPPETEEEWARVEAAIRKRFGAK